MILGTGAWNQGYRADTLTHQQQGIGYIRSPDNEGQLVRFNHLDHNTAHQITAP